ncbi:XrtA/PEP-CTERM system-associated ATPase [Desulfonatronovibrio magnus]|uniref:XrtA/PEP-CTERM system-associated ATPase n=1 Tax=Desulfonatronovibrio magnus TaxID=698827 RepID=UPI000696178A|nr:XrtA/PEP-CTERM system-associated ATPase [Desulfonatronovibrio magnus]
MYNIFFGFREKPFNIAPNPGFLYPSSRHSMALTYLEYGLSENIGFILLTGEIGTGKTTLVRHLLSRIGSAMEVAVLFNTNISPEELIKQVLREFEVESADDKSDNLDRLNNYLISLFSRGKRPLLVIDEAQNLGMEVLEEVRMLSNLQTDKESLLQIMLVGQPELRVRIRDPRLAQLAQRIAVSYHLSPMNREESKEYIIHRLKSAGSLREEVFSDEAMDMIFEKSKGIPRSINILCDAALVYAYADEQKSVSTEIMEQTVRDREENGVVPEGVVWVESTSNSGNGNGSGKMDISEGRLAFLESRVADLAARLEWQITNYKEENEMGHEAIVSKFSQLLDQERKKCDRLLIQCSQYRLRIQDLSNELADTQESYEMHKVDSKEMDQVISSSKPGILRRLFGAR